MKKNLLAISLYFSIPVIALILFGAFFRLRNTLSQIWDAKQASDNLVLKEIKQQLLLPLCNENFESDADYPNIGKYFAISPEYPGKVQFSDEKKQEFRIREFKEAFRPRLSGEETERKTDCDIFSTHSFQSSFKYKEYFFEDVVPDNFKQAFEKTYSYVVWVYPTHRATIHIDVVNGKYKFGGTGVSAFGSIPTKSL